MFLLIADRKESKKIQPPKKKVKSSRNYYLICFLSCFFGDRTNPSFANHYTFYIKIKICKRGWFSLLIYLLSVRLLSALHDKNKFKFLLLLNFNYFFECYASYFAFLFLVLFFVKEGWFPPVYENNTLSPSLAILSPGELLFIRWVYCSFSVFPFLVSLPSPSLLPRDRWKNLKSKSVFLFYFKIVFTYRVNAKNQKNIVTEKGEKNSRSSSLTYFFISLLREED